MKFVMLVIFSLLLLNFSSNLLHKIIENTNYYILVLIYKIGENGGLRIGLVYALKK